ncbi:hypothetical protein HAP47_0029920 [Bradyrhizobium sp. 41S5]|uniref:hypothetical protein n=1 Tax=Bradyrhizobium sp. 41S5 TaxID=1404443 RepID=UPI00156BBF5A|nr:hypothetical protein [Bradyrhizobium sp. 41S5]UFX43409.1 hypothetical protein HAP47_0029920 [Bradyrhizobium sp. 41S5]
MIAAVACSAAAVLIATGFTRMAQNLNSGTFPSGSSATLASGLATVLPLILREGLKSDHYTLPAAIADKSEAKIESVLLQCMNLLLALLRHAGRP